MNFSWSLSTCFRASLRYPHRPFKFVCISFFPYISFLVSQIDFTEINVSLIMHFRQETLYFPTAEILYSNFLDCWEEIGKNLYCVKMIIKPIVSYWEIYWLHAISLSHFYEKKRARLIKWWMNSFCFKWSKSADKAENFGILVIGLLNLDIQKASLTLSLEFVSQRYKKNQSLKLCNKFPRHWKTWFIFKEVFQ